MTNPLGRIVNHDPRNRNHAFTAPRVVQRSVVHRLDAANVDQFYTGGCVGFSGTNLLNCVAAGLPRRRYNLLFEDEKRPRRINRYLDNLDGLENYSGATFYDPFDWTYPPDDEGSSALGLMQFWKTNGIIESYEWCFTFNDFLAALQQQPVLVGTEWFEGMMEPNHSGILTIGGESVGGHEYLAAGDLKHDRLIRCENSWGPRWGMGGAFYLTYDDMALLLANDGDAVVAKWAA